MPKLVPVVFLSLVITSCGSVNGDYCEAERKCEGGNEKDEAACLAERDGVTNAAEEYGCLEQHETWAECVVEKASCEPTGHDGADQLTTRDPATDADRCETEHHKLHSCIDGASARD